jgi:twitching motility protein PilT
MPADNWIETIVEFVEREAYTDIFIRPGNETRIKTPLGWVLVSDLAKGSRPAPIDRNMLEQLIGTLTGDGEWLGKMKRSAQSLAFMMPLDRRGARLRFKVALCAPGANAGHGDVPSDFTVNIRKLPATIPTIQATGLPQSLTSMLTQAGGLLIVTGTVCCGKTTTLASLVDYLNHHRHANIITLERLTEYLFKADQSIITQRTIPGEVPTFLKGIEDALDGQAVDVMMIGEVVDKPTMDAMLRAAESGHLVVATMHARNAVGAISRIIDMFSGDDLRMRLAMLADKLTGVVAQKLLPNKKGDGYVLAYEILHNNTPAVADAIRNNNARALQDQMQQGAEYGMVTLNQTLRKLIRDQLIDPRLALEATYDRSELDQMIDH